MVSLNIISQPVFGARYPRSFGDEHSQFLVQALRSLTRVSHIRLITLVQRRREILPVSTSKR